MITTVAGTEREPMDGDCFIAVMDHTGDTKHVWNPQNTAEVDAARETFTKLRKSGYICFSVGPDGEKKEQVNEFNPNMGKMIMSPALVGG